MTGVTLMLHAAGVVSMKVLQNMNEEEETEVLDMVRAVDWGPGHQCLLRELVEKGRSQDA